MSTVNAKNLGEHETWKPAIAKIIKQYTEDGHDEIIFAKISLEGLDECGLGKVGGWDSQLNESGFDAFNCRRGALGVRRQDQTSKK